MNKGTIIRTVTLILAIINQVAVVVGGILGAAPPTWYIIASVVLTVITALWSGWKNNDWTTPAKFGSAVMHALKDGKITPEEVADLLNQNAEALNDNKDE